MYQVENEEMVCTDADVNYGQLDSFSHERNETDVHSKVLLFSTLIPPLATMLNNEACCRNQCRFVLRFYIIMYYSRPDIHKL